jgi:hypothetical protein
MLGARLAYQLLNERVPWPNFAIEITAKYALYAPLFSLSSVLTYIRKENPGMQILHLIVDELQATVCHTQPYAGRGLGAAPEERLALAIHRCINDSIVNAEFFVIATYACTAVDPRALTGASSDWKAPVHFALGPLMPAATKAILHDLPEPAQQLGDRLLPLLGGNPRAVVYLREHLRSAPHLEDVWQKLIDEIALKWNLLSFNTPLLPLLALSGLPVAANTILSGVAVSDLPVVGMATLEHTPDKRVVIKLPPALIWAAVESFRESA